MSDRITVSLSEENVAWMDAQNLNRSAFVDDLISEYRGSDSSSAARELRRKQIQSELDAVEAKRESLRQEMELLAEQESDEAAERRTDLDDLLDHMAESDVELPRDHSAVTTLAREWFDGDLEEAWGALRERNAERSDSLPEEHFNHE